MDLNEIVKEAQKFQHDMEEIQKQLANEEIAVSSDSGDVKVEIKGNQFTSLKIAESLQKESPEKLQEVVLSTFQKALDASIKKNQEALKKITANLSLPIQEEIKSGVQKG